MQDREYRGVGRISAGVRNFDRDWGAGPAARDGEQRVPGGVIRALKDKRGREMRVLLEQIGEKLQPASVERAAQRQAEIQAERMRVIGTARAAQWPAIVLVR